MSAVLVDVIWQDRILSSSAFSKPGTVAIGGGQNADVTVPVLSPFSTHKLLHLGNQCRVNLAPGMTCEVWSTDTTRELNPEIGFYFLRQGESARVGFKNNLISLRVRPVDLTRKAAAGSLFEISVSEKMAIILAFLLSFSLGYIMQAYLPADLQSDEPRLHAPLRKATIRFDRPILRDLIPEVVRPPATSARPSPPAAKPTPGNLLSVLNSKGIRSALGRTISDGNSLRQSAISSNGRSEVSEPGPANGRLREVGSGRNEKSVGMGDDLLQRVRPSYQIGGIAEKGHLNIVVDSPEATITSGMDREAIQRVIRSHLREIRSCYETELQRNSNLYGKLVIQWDIEERGRVTRALVKSSSLGNSKVATCILTRLNNWTFPEPPPHQIGRISYPFIFSSQ